MSIDVVIEPRLGDDAALYSLATSFPDPTTLCTNNAQDKTQEWCEDTVRHRTMIGGSRKKP